MQQQTQDVPQPDLLTANFLPQFNLASDHATSVRRRTWKTRFLPEHVYEYYARQNANILHSLPAGHVRYREIPPEFIDCMPLDRALLAEDTGNGPQTAHTTGAFGRVTSVFKVVSAEDGFSYALRRVDNFRTTPHVLDTTVQRWAAAAHPSVIPLRRAFHPTTSRGGPPPNALFFLHDYYPGAKSLREMYLENSYGLPIPENVLWSYICQLVAGLRAVHDANLSFRGLHPAHILVTGHGRVRFSSAGVLDILESDAPKPINDMKALDVVSLGQLILHLAVRDRTAHYPANIQASLDAVKRTYSPSVLQLVIVLLSKQSVPIHEVCRLLAPQLLRELDEQWDHNDCLEHLLGREADNGRIMRILLKLGFINERPEQEGDPQWAETGDRYLLKLFRDFVFHQLTDDGRPVLDLAHVLDALHSLDVGSPQRVLLSSRDGASILVSTYATLRAAVDGAFSDLKAASKKPTGAAGEGTAAQQEEAAVQGDPELPAWMKRPKIPAVVRSRTGNSLRNRSRLRASMGFAGAMGGLGLPGVGLPFGLMAGAAAVGLPFGMVGAAGMGDGMGMGMGMGMGGTGQDQTGAEGGYYTQEGMVGEDGQMLQQDGSLAYGDGSDGQQAYGGMVGQEGGEGGEGGVYHDGQQLEGQGMHEGAQEYYPTGQMEGMEGYSTGGGYIAEDGSYVPASMAYGAGQGGGMEGHEGQGQGDEDTGAQGYGAGQGATFNVDAQEFKPTWASQ